MIKINKNSTLSEIIRYPEAKKILGKYNLPCLYCPMAIFELRELKLNQVCEMYNIDLKNLLKELNKIIKK